MLEPVASFFLYGEPPRPADAGFLHVETLAIRSSPANWQIRAHAHRDLVQLFLVELGGGEMQADGRTFDLAAPCLILMPRETIHAFAWDPGSAGQVLTIGSSTLGRLLPRAPELARLFASLATLPVLNPEVASGIAALLRSLGRESAWQVPGHELATDALLTLVLVESVRVLGGADDVPARDVALVGQFRALIEASFRERPPFSAHLARLDVSERRLREACRSVAQTTPMQMVLDRTMLEARRMLVSTNRSAAEIGYHLGFTDPAYFSRLFRAHTGETLREFRRGVRA